MRSEAAVDWFEALTGFRETRYEETRARLAVEGTRLHSEANGRHWEIGRLELASLRDLRARAAGVRGDGRLRVRIVQGDVRRMHREPENAGALFQVASQFNLLEMVSPDVTPEDGVTRYQYDRTQGPACAIAAGAATIWRNYFAPAGDGSGQTGARQIDALAPMGAALSRALGMPMGDLWQMHNGYALATSTGLGAVGRHIAALTPQEQDTLRGTLCIGFHSDVEVTDGASSGHAGPLVSQAFCSALPVAYAGMPRARWAPFASLVLEAAYEATLWAAVLNAARGASNVVLLTLLGGGAFGNAPEWIHAALRRALHTASGHNLDVKLVSHSAPAREIEEIAEEFALDAQPTTSTTSVKSVQLNRHLGMAAHLNSEGRRPPMTQPLSRQALLRPLVEAGTVKMIWSAQVMEQPAPFVGRRVAADRVRGMLLGLAIGDALGNTSESQSPRDRHERYGEIRHYLPNRYASWKAVGLPSDDTQLAFWTLAHVLEHEGVEPDALAALFCSHRIFGIGRATHDFVVAWKRTRDWRSAAQPSAGNGGLMRIASVLAPHLATGSAELWADAALGTAITHNDRAAIATSVAFVGLLAEALTMPAPPPSGWWVEAFVARAGPLEGDATEYAPRGGPLLGTWSGPLWRFVAEQVPRATSMSSLAAQEIWYSGAYLLETVPTVLHILARHAHDPEEAIVHAVNDTKDNDTIAAIVGAAVGALHGEAALPMRWRDGLLGRVVADVDDRRVFDLLDAAAERARRAGEPQ
jgi:ADP-ribosylglycohydrolase